MDTTITYSLEDLYTLQEIDIEEIIDFAIKSKKYLIKYELETGNIVRIAIKIKNQDILCRIYESNSKDRKKSKYKKEVFNQNKVDNLIENIGITECQKAHAVDEEIYKYIKLEEFLKYNGEPFKQIELYERDIYNNYSRLRFKNLFSQFEDEISDFEKISFLVREDSKRLFIYFDLDEEILSFDMKNKDLFDRKFARELAKSIYHSELGFTDKLLLNLFKDREIFTLEKKMISKFDPQIWQKINKEDMNIKVLKQSYDDIISKRKTDKQKYYQTKRSCRRKLRRTKSKDINSYLDV